MKGFHIDSAKHPHPRRYRNATLWLVVGIGVGIALTLIGIWAMTQGTTGPLVWLATLTLIGPSIVFLAAVGHSTYLERLEQERYGAVYQDEENPGTMGSAH